MRDEKIVLQEAKICFSLKIAVKDSMRPSDMFMSKSYVIIIRTIPKTGFLVNITFLYT